MKWNWIVVVQMNSLDYANLHKNRKFLLLKITLLWSIENAIGNALYGTVLSKYVDLLYCCVCESSFDPGLVIWWRDILNLWWCGCSSLWWYLCSSCWHFEALAGAAVFLFWVFLLYHVISQLVSMFERFFAIFASKTRLLWTVRLITAKFHSW